MAAWKWILLLQLVMLAALEASPMGSRQVDEFESFGEELLLRPLKDGRILAHWQFTTHWQPCSQVAEKHFGMFPKTLAHIVHKFSVQELHLSLTQGRWDYAHWGEPLLPAPVGAELWSWLQPSPERDVEKQWQGLTHALSGLMCGSLNLIDSKSTCKPHSLFQPTIETSLRRRGGDLRYGALPREVVCTENLTPWAKLLPCRLKTGLASLINPVHIAKSIFRSLTLNVLVNESRVELVQTLSIVLTPNTKPNTNHKVDLQSLLASTLGPSCPLVSSSFVYVDRSLLEESGVSLSLKPDPDFSNSLARYNTTGLETTFSLQMEWKQARNGVVWSVDKLQFHRYITGHGQQEGGISIELYNSNDKQLKAMVLQMIPYYVRVYFHTLIILHNDTRLSPIEYTKVFTSQWIRPAEDRTAPTHMELALVLPPYSKITLFFQFEKVFLHFAEYPPDPNRGMHIPAALVAYTFNQEEASSWLKRPFFGLSMEERLQPRNSSWRYTEVAVVNLPTPDFSMPYNVMTLTGAAMALLFASVFKLLTGPPQSHKPPTPSWWRSLLAKLKKRKQD